MDSSLLVDIIKDLIDDDEISIDDASFNYVDTPVFDSLFLLSLIAVIDDGNRRLICILRCNLC